MTNAKWLACTDPEKMLVFWNSKTSVRKLRLYACACCRAIWHMLKDKRSRAAVDIAEQYADREAPKRRLTAARIEARKAVLRRNISYERQSAFHACLYAVDDHPFRAAKQSAQAVARAVLCIEDTPAEDYDAMLKAQADMLRDIFNNPFRGLPAIKQIWLEWNDATVPRIAQSIYDTRDFSLLPILADALEEAGCDNAGMLNHCRQPGKHVRGCWVVDLLLGKS